MNHQFRVKVYGRSQLALVQQATEKADEFFGPGNWREMDAAFVTEASTGGYCGEYYFTDVPEIEERTIQDA